MGYKLVERRDHLAVHGYFDSLERAAWHLEHNIPRYVARGFFVDKTLKADDFIILPS
jgi:hypothetical protein